MSAGLSTEGGREGHEDEDTGQCTGGTAEQHEPRAPIPLLEGERPPVHINPNMVGNP